jgi:multimeric flavodoxin WrbA
MKKILAIIASPRKGETYNAVQLFEQKLRTYENVEFEYIHLKDKNVQQCKGCLNCFIKGENYCPVRDDTEEIFKKIMEADGVIFATPVYSLQVSGYMKTLLDRLAYVFHRPCFFDKAFIAITVQGIYGYEEVVKYLNKVAHFWGFTEVQGLGLNTPPGFRSQRMKNDIEVKTDKAVKDFYKVLSGKKLIKPKLSDFMMFRMGRSIKPYLSALPKDYEYFLEKGWMKSDYYYPVKLGPVRKLIGKFFDKQGRKYGEKMKKEELAV